MTLKTFTVGNVPCHIAELHLTLDIKYVSYIWYRKAAYDTVGIEIMIQIYSK